MRPKMDFGDRTMVLHGGCKDPVVYYFYEDGAKVWVEIDPRDTGKCDEECILFRVGDCETKRSDELCDRPFKPPDGETAEELGMH